ncbi:ABC transporter ATP-binding protein [Thermodesulfobacteriota bacterium]
MEDVQLKVKDITVHYEKAEAVKNVTIEVADGAAVSIIGANGAGKTTIMQAISGLVRITKGEIWFQDTRIDRMSAPEIVKRGLIQVPEGKWLFPYMSVSSNLKLGAYLRKDKVSISKDLEEIFNRFPILLKRLNQQAGTLSGGEQQMLAIGRSLMARPKLLLLDEPSLGLAPLMIEELADVIEGINRDGITILLVEQNAGLVSHVAEKGYVLEVGKIVMEGNIKELLADESVEASFLGG